MTFRLSRRIAGFALLLLAGVATAPAAGAAEETTVQTICRLIDGAADAHDLPRDYFTRLIWRESSFRPHVTSPAGAQGIAQFMPGTADEQGLDDPFDPELAIPASAKYLKSLRNRFGNFGLAAAAYNAGPTRLAKWLDSGGYLPLETEDYVLFITGRSVTDWSGKVEVLLPADEKAAEVPIADPKSAALVKPKAAGPTKKDCETLVASIRSYAPSVIEGAYAPFGVQLSGNFSKSRAIASYHRQVARFPSILEGKPTLILGKRGAGRGRRAFYRVRLPAETLREATRLCQSLRNKGGACVVLRN
ncbi:lytic transglycosylase domain-containing protein [Kaistia adipata]|uniref:lytic transglycosylase domain-containing protein n=1 Tax=Kaistia adipata TaxID=166954 RepID=UPI00041E2D05|nr:lytic transglycosylase domain-containing protein [Kaistia adipata]